MWIEVFKAGKHKSANGISKEFTSDDIKNIEMKYNKAISSDESSEAPLVKGHPADNDPAFGWIEKLARKGDKLLAKIKNPDKSIISEIKDKKYRKVSVALYPDMMLRHVGLLGASAPAVKGLKPVSFADNTEYSEFANESYSYIKDNSELNDEIEKLRNENVKLKQKINLAEKKSRIEKFSEYAENLNNQGIFISPANKGRLIDIFEQLHLHSGEKADEIETNLKEFIENIDSVNLTGEYSFANESNTKGESEKNKIHNKALQIQNSNPGLSYEEAVLEAHTFFYK